MEPAVLQARAKQRVERVRRNIMMAFLRPDWKVPGMARAFDGYTGDANQSWPEGSQDPRGSHRHLSSIPEV